MATKYVSSLTGEEMDAALIDMAYHNSEAYAVGTRNGVAVGSSDVTYHNNSKYWAEQVYGYTDRAEAAAERAEAAVPSGTAGAVFFDRAQTLTTAQQEQARANIMAGRSNRNLLDNPWFTVNQRGWTSGTANNVYTVDRWKTSSSSSYTVAVNADGSLTINALFYQKVSNKFRTGTVLTISYMKSDGTIVSKTGTITSSEGFSVGNNAFGFYYRPSTGVGDFQMQLSGETVVACKLELGSVSTLANDVPPDYGEELLKCMRYFQRMKASAGTAYIGTGVCFTSQAYCVVNLPVPLRTTSVTTAINGALSVQIPGSVLTASGQSFYVRTPSTIMIAATISGATAGQACLLALKDSGNYIDLSADL